MGGSQEEVKRLRNLYVQREAIERGWYRGQRGTKKREKERGK